MMPSRTGAADRSEHFRDQHEAAVTEDLAAAAAAAAGRDWKQATTAAERLSTTGRHLHTTVVTDALAAGLDWWALGDLLNMHPQAAFLEYANVLDTLPSPAEARPDLAVVCTAGLAATSNPSTASTSRTWTPTTV